MIFFLLQIINTDLVQLVDIHFMYEKANGHSNEARCFHENAFPDRQLSCTNTFLNIHRPFREAGKVTENFVDREA